MGRSRGLPLRALHVSDKLELDITELVVRHCAVGALWMPATARRACSSSACTAPTGLAGRGRPGSVPRRAAARTSGYDIARDRVAINAPIGCANKANSLHPGMTISRLAPSFAPRRRDLPPLSLSPCP